MFVALVNLQTAARVIRPIEANYHSRVTFTYVTEQYMPSADDLSFPLLSSSSDDTSYRTYTKQSTHLLSIGSFVPTFPDISEHRLGYAEVHTWYRKSGYEGSVFVAQGAMLHESMT